jgi:outer membrane protein
MKNPTIFRSLLTSLLLGVLAIGGLAPALAQEASAVQKIGIIDVRRILEESVAGKSVITEREALRDQKTQELSGLQSQFEAAQQRYNDGRLTLSQDKLVEMEKELEDLTVQMRRSQDDAQRELQSKQAEQFEKIETRVMPIISQVGEEFGYTLIFNKFQSGLVYAIDGIDITNLVIERYDQISAGASN